MKNNRKLLLRFKAVFQTLLGSPLALHFFQSWMSRDQLSADACRQTVFCQVILGLATAAVPSTTNLVHNRRHPFFMSMQPQSASSPHHIPKLLLLCWEIEFTRFIASELLFQNKYINPAISPQLCFMYADVNLSVSITVTVYV